MRHRFGLSFFRETGRLSFVIRFVKVIFIVIALLLALVLVVFVGANLYLQSAVVQTRISQATEASLGYPVTIASASFTPWGGLSLGPIHAIDPENPKQNRFQAEQINVHFAWLPLFSQKIVITAISVVEPVAIFSENAPIVFMPPTERIEVVLPDLPKAQKEDVPKPAEESTKSTPSTFTIEVQKFQVTEGKIVICNPGASPKASFEGISIKTKIQKDFTLQGTVGMDLVKLENRLFFRNVALTFLRKDGRIQIPSLDASLAGGTIHAEAEINETTGLFATKVTVADAKIAQFLSEMGIPSQRTSGALNGELTLAGSQNVESLVGEGAFQFSNATLEPLDLIKQVGNLLQIDELQLFTLPVASLKVKIMGGILQIEELQLESKNLMIKSQGTIDLQSGGMELPSKLLINQRLQKNLGGLLPGLVDSETLGYKELPFRLYGTMLRPKTDLLERLGGARVEKEVGRFLQNIFGGGQKKKEEQK